MKEIKIRDDFFPLFLLLPLLATASIKWAWPGKCTSLVENMNSSLFRFEKLGTRKQLNIKYLNSLQTTNSVCVSRTMRYEAAKTCCLMSWTLGIVDLSDETE